MIEKMKSLLADEEGATLVEYALLVALIAVFCVGAITLLGEKVKETFDNITAKLPG